MNSIHDLGGMDGFGPVESEENEPVFHDRWEGRVYALTRAVKPWGVGRNWPGFRFILESIPPADYLRMSYYERWFHMMVNRLAGNGLVSESELETGRADTGARTPEILPSSDTGSLGFGLLDVDVPARFRLGDSVRARNLHASGHTRLPVRPWARGDGGGGLRGLCAPGQRFAGTAALRPPAARVLGALRGAGALG